MARKKLILDADIISYLLKKDRKIEQRYRLAIDKDNAEFFISPMVYYQVKRGLLDKKAKRKILLFDKLVNTMSWLEFEKEDWDIAITLYLFLKHNGFSPKHQDADILIAAQAERKKAKIITNNLKDFKRLGADCETWK